MPRIFVGNFDFEHELSAGQAGRRYTPGKGQQLSRAFQAVWVAVADSEDLVIAAEPVDPAAFAGLAALGLPIPRILTDGRAASGLKDAKLVPWGWTPSMCQLADHRGWTAAAPPLEAVRLVNSRSFRLGLEQELGIAIPGAAIARSLDELTCLIAEAAARALRPAGWILKANFGMSGRESGRGRGGELPEALRNWARSRLDSSGPIVYEPLLDRVAEAGIQIEIPQSGPPRLVGLTTLVVDGTGVYRGSRFGDLGVEAETWQPAITTALAAACRVQQCGYFGPLGIDAMRYRDGRGREQLRPLQDLNARYTMGRLALGFLRILPPGWCGSWLHSANPASSLADQLLRDNGGFAEEQARIVSTTPRLGQPGPVTFLALARHPAILEQIEGLV